MKPKRKKRAISHGNMEAMARFLACEKPVIKDDDEIDGKRFKEICLAYLDLLAVLERIKNSEHLKGWHRAALFAEQALAGGEDDDET